MTIVSKLDELGSGAWIALAILGFVFWWPAGLALLAFSIWSGRLRFGCGHRMERFQDKMDRMGGRMGRPGGNGFWGPPSSGNRAFDDYRAETLRRLEDEQKEFKDFLQRLRMAKDKAEFDQFMAERRRGNGGQTPTEPSPQT
ncbi:DUF2852 domain-containing protein [Aquabacter spiritensis]|uniref:Uncharacterized protein DUF2852 n=1 Tax=Aquabacter spiritensis TaxID=933073 RepID=A0A4R3M4H1_9HYPH|nr:DUF2852 domain-containing protein [Aquabacter spiritensis]TCT07736.1 uncharacterized protein DUF2852 [Aquabacter spiritensis]